MPQIPVAFQTATKQLAEHKLPTDLGAVATHQVQGHARQTDMNAYTTGLRRKLVSLLQVMVVVYA